MSSRAVSARSGGRTGLSREKKDIFKGRIQKLVSWQKCIAVGGDYAEK